MQSLHGTYPGAMSAELADVDNDNWLDVVLGINAVAPRAIVLRNLGRAAPTSGTAMGAWNGFATLPFSTLVEDPTVASTSTVDVETADVDGDGRIDFVLACGALAGGLVGENRLFLNATAGGVVSFVERTRQQLNPTPVLDDTRDIELFDLDLDGDMDLVVGNDGPDLVYVNSGGTFTARSITTPARVDATMDIAVGDLDNDGFPDLYVGNGVTTGTILPQLDALYLSTGGAMAWTDSSALLPDNSGALPPWPTSDVELIDVGLGSTLSEVLVGSGPRCQNLGLTAAGLRYMHSAGGAAFLSVLEPLVLPPAARSEVVNDIEVGDWQLAHPDLDIGLATMDTGTGSPGLLVVIR